VGLYVVYSLKRSPVSQRNEIFNQMQWGNSRLSLIDTQCCRQSFPSPSRSRTHPSLALRGHDQEKQIMPSFSGPLLVQLYVSRTAHQPITSQREGSKHHWDGRTQGEQGPLLSIVLSVIACSIDGHTHHTTP
jgi:hypothetical protein